MKPKILQYSCEIEADQQAVCHFHTNTNNLPTITPKWIEVTIESMDEPFIEKSHVSLLIRRFGIDTRWVMQIERMDCPNTVVDTMVAGPFANFRHERLFHKISDHKTRMDETITLKLPLGWLGAIIFPLIKWDMDKMFSYRHQATKAYFSK